MSTRSDDAPKPGGTAILLRLPPGFLDDLPADDQRAISSVIGTPLLFTKYDEHGRAELEFPDEDGIIHFIYVPVEFRASVTV